MEGTLSHKTTDQGSGPSLYQLTMRPWIGYFLIDKMRPPISALFSTELLMGIQNDNGHTRS